MAKYKLTKEASADIVKIFRYTDKVWGVEQTDKYGVQIFAVFEQIAKSPDIGSVADYVFAGVRKMPIGKHLIFYAKQKKVVILRVLHENMDIGNQSFNF